MSAEPGREETTAALEPGAMDQGPALPGPHVPAEAEEDVLPGEVMQWLQGFIPVGGHVEGHLPPKALKPGEFKFWQWYRQHAGQRFNARLLESSDPRVHEREVRESGNHLVFELGSGVGDGDWMSGGQAVVVKAALCSGPSSGAQVALRLQELRAESSGPQQLMVRLGQLSVESGEFGGLLRVHGSLQLTVSHTWIPHFSKAVVTERAYVFVQLVEWCPSSMKHLFPDSWQPDGLTPAGRAARTGLPELPWTAGTAGRLLGPVARSVAAAHALTPALVHRDISPDNVLVRTDGTLCLADYGLALPIQQGQVDTRTRALGKTSRIPPGLERDPETGLVRMGLADDVWLTGRLIAELITGLHATPLDGSGWADELPEGTPESLAGLLHSLAVDPRDQWPSMSTLAGALEDAWEKDARRIADAELEQALHEAKQATADAKRAATEANTAVEQIAQERSAAMAELDDFYSLKSKAAEQRVLEAEQVLQAAKDTEAALSGDEKLFTAGSLIMFSLLTKKLENALVDWCVNWIETHGEKPSEDEMNYMVTWTAPVLYLVSLDFQEITSSLGRPAIPRLEPPIGDSDDPSLLWRRWRCAVDCLAVMAEIERDGWPVFLSTWSDEGAMWSLIETIHGLPDAIGLSEPSPVLGVNAATRLSDAHHRLLHSVPDRAVIRARSQSDVLLDEEAIDCLDMAANAALTLLYARTGHLCAQDNDPENDDVWNQQVWFTDNFQLLADIGRWERNGCPPDSQPQWGYLRWQFPIPATSVWDYDDPDTRILDIPAGHLRWVFAGAVLAAAERLLVREAGPFGSGPEWAEIKENITRAAVMCMRKEEPGGAPWTHAAERQHARLEALSNRVRTAAGTPQAVRPVSSGRRSWFKW